MSSFGVPNKSALELRMCHAIMLSCEHATNLVKVVSGTEIDLACDIMSDVSIEEVTVKSKTEISLGLNATLTTHSPGDLY